jgi:2-C-methyl-D-erythritol 2,4-cyclodiphosphate synthase
MRVGFGFDAHRLTDGIPLILGGVNIPSERGLEGWSDADVLVHAIIDAMLGAAALGDIGSHFPPGNPEYEGISSIALLERTAGMLRAHGWSVGNIDATVVAEEPSLRPFAGQMIRNISEAVSVDQENVSVKATTTEGMGFTGRKDGIAAYAAALIERTDADT